MRHPARTTVAVALAATLPALAAAEAVRTERTMSLELAARLAAETVAACLAGGHSVTANPAAATLIHMPGFLVLGGGVPVRAGNDVIGAIGVGGAPSGMLDEQCANAALDKVKGLLK